MRSSQSRWLCEARANARPLHHNEDYWRFLVRDVWRIAEDPLRVVDFGCGFGWAGQFLMPMLAPGATGFIDRTSLFHIRDT